MGRKTHILIINFTANWTAEECNKGTTELTPVFAEFYRLIVKNFLFNYEKKMYGSCYMFNSKEDMESYIKSKIFKSIIENPDWSDFIVRDFEVHAEASEIQKNLKSKAA